MNVGDIEVTIPERVHPIVYTLVANGLATLLEIKNDYDIWDVLDLYEIFTVNSYNKVTAMKGGLNATRLHETN